MAEERRDALLAGAVAYALAHGVGGVSLRPLAAALGTSDRMLVYHFGSKDRLIDEVLAAASAQLLAAVTAAGGTATAPGPLFHALWAAMSQESAGPYVRLFFEVYGLALQRPERFGPALRSVVDVWHDTVERRLDGDVPTATVVVAGVEGLLLDLLISGDRERVDDAATDLARRLERP